MTLFRLLLFGMLAAAALGIAIGILLVTPEVVK